jgi:hypothetical protein
LYPTVLCRIFLILDCEQLVPAWNTEKISYIYNSRSRGRSWHETKV